MGKDGVRADPEKTKAISEMAIPQSVSDLRRFLGMVNQLGKFSPQISELTKPLRELLSVKPGGTNGSNCETDVTAIRGSPHGIVKLPSYSLALV